MSWVKGMYYKCMMYYKCILIINVFVSNEISERYLIQMTLIHNEW